MIGMNYRENGDIVWYGQDPKSHSAILHRAEGPAIIKPNGDRYWYRYGYLHREDGPAVEYVEKSEFHWFLDGRRVTKSKNIKAGQRRFEKLRDQMTIAEVMDG